MSEEEDEGRTTWIPIAIATGLVAAILVVIFTVDGADNATPAPAPSTPSSSSTP